MACAKDEKKIVLEATTVFLLMKKGFPISRNVRAQWMLEHLDTLITIQCHSSKQKEAEELEIVSVLPKNKPESWSPQSSHQFLYKVTSTTSIIFLAHKYRIVLNLDLSPSLATVDIQHGEIVIDELCVTTKHFLEGIIKPFVIPGSNRKMQPEIYVTVIAHTPFFTSPAQPVLVQGWLVTTSNVNQLTNFIEWQLNILEEKVASVTAVASQQLENLRAESERLVGGLFEESSTCLNKNNSITNTSIISPESTFVNMLRYGMLALTLLPEHSCAHMIIVSDGIIGTTDVHVLDSVIQQLRATTVACSFLHVGSTYHPHSADGLVPYQDLLYFIARATLGTYMSFIPRVTHLDDTEMNTYHKNFLCWQLYREVLYDDLPYYPKWHSKNSLFYEQKSTQLLQKKQIEDKVTCTLSSLLCCRLREGYLIKRANVRDDVLEICFVLLWKSSVSLEYAVTCPWSITKSLSASNTIQYTITIEAPYEFLHDITCLSKKPLKSQYRQGVVNQFWAALTSLTESDAMLAHFSWFPEFGWTWYSVPDTIRSGMPVFYSSAYPSPSTVQLSDAACPQFGQIWQPVVSLNPLQWARWMHTQRVTLILSHDRPLPKHLHQANQSGRFQCVQSRQAAAVLYAMLKNWATFVLVENHTYVQFIYKETEKPPVSFSLIRINCKGLCVILNIAFAAGTEGVVRHNVVIDLLDRLSKLTLPNRPTGQRETPSCTIIHKSLERILIRYERMPTDLNSIVFPDGTQTNTTKSTIMLGGILPTSLSRYLYHNRWLWHIKRPLVQTIPGITLPRLNITAIARILSTITRMRLAEGFSFTYSAAGILNMVLEVQMQGVDKNDGSYPCIIQYILFPPHVVSSSILERDSVSEEDTDEGTADGEVSIDDFENFGDFQIVSEIWIEPQCGMVQLPIQPAASYMHRLPYYELPDAIAQVDEGCINALLTLEYLSLLCQIVPNEKSSEIIYGQVHQDIKLSKRNVRNIKNNECSAEELYQGLPIADEKIHPMHFFFDALNILPKCQQAELLFSMFANGSTAKNESQGRANKILMDNVLEHVKQLHNKELLLTSAESQKFTTMLLNRSRDGGPRLPFFSLKERPFYYNDQCSYPRWKCFIKGISTTHVIITILPASEKDVRLFNSSTHVEDFFVSNNSEKNYKSSGKFGTFRSGENGNFQTFEENRVIPVYIYDCSLASLIDTLTDKSKILHNKDIYQDHTFRLGQQDGKDFVELKFGCNSKPSSPESKSDDSDNTASDQRSLTEHCKRVSLAHCHCYVVAVYKSLVLQHPLSYEDMEAAVEQCEETLIEIDITNYLRCVCRHLSKLSEKDTLDQLEDSACKHVEQLHDLIRDKFEKIMTVAFGPVPAHPEFYYCSPTWMGHKMDLLELQKSDSDDEIENVIFRPINIDSTSHNHHKKEDSKPKFLNELKKLEIDKYRIQQEGKLFYFVKSMEYIPTIVTQMDSSNDREETKVRHGNTVDSTEKKKLHTSNETENETQHNSETDSKIENYGFEDSNMTERIFELNDTHKGQCNSKQGFQWLRDLDNRENFLPNFWLILKVESDYVNVYFHCRFLEIASAEVSSYWQTQKTLISQIKSTCRQVNQYLLLQNLHKTSKCSELLETETTEDFNWKSETTNEFNSSIQNRDSAQNFAPGMFRCRVVWEFTFRLHPRLKTGPGRSGLSRGIKALHGVLNRFAVTNRSNMFVYQENNKNVFYLRLHEQISDGKMLQNKLSESDEKLVVSRSNSVISLSQTKLSDNAMVNDTRPRVRSFSEKESNILNRTEDSIVLMVHGISDAGPEVKRDLVQVLQNRLDDAVLEVLSVMLARNPMCKLTPDDVHFIQPPKPPECIIKLCIEKHCIPYIGALEFYLRQNILQFLYIPKYTDNKVDCHFQDYSQIEGSTRRVAETDIFLYNQSHSSGSKGIACIAFAITDDGGEPIKSLDRELVENGFPENIREDDFENIVATSVFDKKSTVSSPLIEFKIWKQGRVNIEALLQKLCSTVKHAIWDLVTEYKFLPTPLTEPLLNATKTHMENANAETSTKSDISQRIVPDLSINRFETGEDGKLHFIYCVTFSQWFRFALEIGVPSVKKHEVNIYHRHSIATIVRELEILIQSQAPDTSSRAFVLKDKQPFTEKFVLNDETTNKENDCLDSKHEDNSNLPHYVPCDFNKDEQGTYTKCILIARNFCQWKASFDETVQSEVFVPKDQKVLQKFNPLILESSFVSRQRIILAKIRNDKITLYMYNWSKEKSEKLMKQANSLGTWLSSRSNFFRNILMQKLGIFHHRPNLTRETNSHYFQITDTDSLTKFSSTAHNDDKEWTRSNNRVQSIKHNQFSWNEVLGQTMRDVKSNSCLHNNGDPVAKAVYDLQELRAREKKVKDDLNKLYVMWQNRSAAPNIPISISALNTSKQHSRLIHFCHTPLLFLPSWRLQSAATRDHSLATQSPLNTNTTVHQQLPQQVQPNQSMQTDMVKWHHELCSLMLSEYKQYLQIMGFNPVQMESLTKGNENQTQQQSYYLKKSMLGGVLLFEIYFSQPFFIVKLHIIECNRLQTKTTSALVNQFLLSFVDACDNIKINMHLHSFTYDFHLRCIHSYIAGNGSWSLQQGYHLIHFLDDFNKYYSKAPNYARNLIYSDIVAIRNLTIPGRILYSYLLSHEKNYNMQVFEMKCDHQDSHEFEYVLVNLENTPSISYCDGQDIRYTDDFDVALIVSYLEQPVQIEKTGITLKYYLMLTSKRELYPKKEVENNKLGKFRTVYNIEKPVASTSAESKSDTNNFKKEILKEFSSDCFERDQDINDKKSDSRVSSINFSTVNNSASAPTPPPVPNSPLTQNTNPPIIPINSSSPRMIQIRQESINYLGYYSSHEQLMQQTIMFRASEARNHISRMIDRGTLQCKTHLLWNKLLESKSTMNYTEFAELCSLAHVEPLSYLDPRLKPLINQPVSWYQTLSKVLQNKYQDHHKQFNTPDGNITHLLILHPSSFQVFMMLTIDLHASKGALYAVYCKSKEAINTGCCIEDIYSLIEGFVNACCFHLWMSLYN
nr:KICSTOR complex protein SZT2-like isoform X4 [Megalopta genalis]